MGVAITELLKSHELKVDSLKGKVLAVDAFNVLYMFVTTIRGPDGSPLMDSKGRITSHLTGLFSRFSNLMEKGVKFVFVFDGEAPELKKKERERRYKLKEEAKDLYEQAKDQGDVENMKKFAARSVFLSEDMVVEAKRLISAMGMPVIDAPSEGEAQAAYLVKKGDAFAVLSQDADCLLNEAPRMVRNLSITARRKMPGQLHHKASEPELIVLKENLEFLGMSQDQLIVLSILVGTDYNYGGVKGIGPKKALKLIEKHGDDFDVLFEEAKWSEHFDFSWRNIFDLIKNMPVTDDYVLDFKNPDVDEIKKILVDEHDFSEERVNSTLLKLEEYKKVNAQKGLGDFF
ncbi:flap endonuclease-1 [Candidatus Woesearchaeota archaeon]|nr:flap endonuclease-1 [Candidatus Woesearchaeota archaeon]